MLIAAAAALAAVAAVVISLTNGSDGDQTPAAALGSGSGSSGATTVVGTASAGGATSGGGSPASTATPPPGAVSTAPEDRVVIGASLAMADANGDVWVLLIFPNAWEGEPPTIDFAHSVQLGAAVELDGLQYGTLWTSAGQIRFSTGIPGAPTLLDQGANPNRVPGEMWITPEGMLAIRLAGNSPTGGVPTSSVNADTTLVRISSLRETGDAEPIVTLDRVPLGGFVLTGTLPVPSWTPLTDVSGSLSVGGD